MMRALKLIPVGKKMWTFDRRREMHYYAGCVFDVHSKSWPKNVHKGWKITFCQFLYSQTKNRYKSIEKMYIHIHFFAVFSFCHIPYLCLWNRFNGFCLENAWHLLLAYGLFFSIPVHIERLDYCRRSTSDFQCIYDNLFANTYISTAKMLIYSLCSFFLHLQILNRWKHMDLKD